VRVTAQRSLSHEGSKQDPDPESEPKRPYNSDPDQVPKKIIPDPQPCPFHFSRCSGEIHIPPTPLPPEHTVYNPDLIDRWLQLLIKQNSHCTVYV
jgi:hypothetical protein